MKKKKTPHTFKAPFVIPLGALADFELSSTSDRATPLTCTVVCMSAQLNQDTEPL